MAKETDLQDASVTVTDPNQSSSPAGQGEGETDLVELLRSEDTSKAQAINNFNINQRRTTT